VNSPLSVAVLRKPHPYHPDEIGRFKLRGIPVDVIERIKSQLTANPVLLFMKGTPDFPQCGFSAAAVRALSAVGAKYNTVNIFEDPELREALKQYSNWPTYPQLYVNGELIGGSDIISEMYNSGELEKVVAAVTEPKDPSLPA
jgi:monothiol glutaredoxin